jgi:hypothetical protein
MGLAARLTLLMGSGMLAYSSTAFDSIQKTAALKDARPLIHEQWASFYTDSFMKK